MATWNIWVFIVAFCILGRSFGRDEEKRAPKTLTATDKRKSNEKEGKSVDNEETVIFGDEPSDFWCQVCLQMREIFRSANEGDERVGSNVTLLNVDQILGLNTLDISLARLDFAPYGVNPPHTHPRATEINSSSRRWYSFNVGKTNDVNFASLGSQNPWLITIAKAVFGSNPLISPNVLTKVFQVDNKVIDYLEKRFN
ncbi:germin-like protein subfamily 1 member 7 [Alnus glutinosa]|uniref:germin-like protein subfamily 1 member 7 n=1 Tax=Alnus glutinosa TaxID=3517 RepID=UPI002D784355|nr:germin-like protein subfamily 1 member 7 [Alnus glutinosa]